MNFYVLLVTCLAFGTIYALECGITSDQNQEDLKRASSMCMNQNKTNDNQSDENGGSEYNSSSDESPESGEHLFLGARRGLNKRTRRSGDSIDSKSNESMHKEPSRNDDQSNNDTEASANCVVQCIFQQFEMMDSKGYPDHSKVSQALLRSAQGRELRDFLQDSTDECFQLMDQGDQMDGCTFSTQLVKCLAEKGKSNCSDWPAGDLPFAHIL